MAKRNKATDGVLILAGIGLGVMTGAAIGLILSRRPGRKTKDEFTETIEDVRIRADHVLQELSEKVAGLVERSHQLRDEMETPSKS